MSYLVLFRYGISKQIFSINNILLRTNRHRRYPHLIFHSFPVLHRVPNPVWPQTKILKRYLHDLFSISLPTLLTASHIPVHQRPKIVTTNTLPSKPPTSQYLGPRLGMMDQLLRNIISSTLHSTGSIVYTFIPYNALTTFQASSPQYLAFPSQTDSVL